MEVKRGYCAAWRKMSPVNPRTLRPVTHLSSFSTSRQMSLLQLSIPIITVRTIQQDWDYSGNVAVNDFNRISKLRNMLFSLPRKPG
jgi:hypothetical protein